jgi:hypothetical protein
MLGPRLLCPDNAIELLGPGPRGVLSIPAHRSLDKHLAQLRHQPIAPCCVYARHLSPSFHRSSERFFI